MAEEHSGFLGRWARRKTEALQGRALDEPVVAAKPAPGPTPVAGATSSPSAATTSGLDSAPASAPPADAAAPPPEKVLSLDDVKALTQSSDFKPFMAQGVGPQVRNAAMKKLFADPHYNVMDGLDIYIDDYSIADPLPQGMLRQMAGAKFLNLFDDEEDKEHDKDEKDAKDPQNRQSAKEPGRAAAPHNAALADSVQADSAQAHAEQTDAAPAPANSSIHPHAETVAKSGDPSDLARLASQHAPLPSDPSPKPT